MFEKLVVENVQSLQPKIEVEFARFTVIVGPSGRGKSAFLRALTAVCFNQAPKKLLSHKKRQARVELTLDDGQVIEWEKVRDKGATYGMGDKTYTRTARAVPPEIAQVLGVRRIEVDKNVAWRPQFHLQFDLPMLLTESSTMAARALAQLTKLSLLVEAQVECRRDRRRVEQQHTAAEEEVGRLRAQLSELPNVKRVRDTVDQASKRLGQADEKLVTAVQAAEIAQDIAGALLLTDLTLPSDQEMEVLEAKMVVVERALVAITESEKHDMSLALAQDKATEVETILAGVEDTYHALVDTLGACPMCGSTETWKKEGAGA